VTKVRFISSLEIQIPYNKSYIILYGMTVMKHLGTNTLTFLLLHHNTITTNCHHQLCYSDITQTASLLNGDVTNCARFYKRVGSILEPDLLEHVMQLPKVELVQFDMW
jgi:hypothetical protein